MKTQSRLNTLFAIFTTVTATTCISILAVLLSVSSASAISIEDKTSIGAKADQATQNIIVVAAQTEAEAMAVSGVNINNADAQMLSEGLKGVGPKKAEAIIQWRERNGGFNSLEQLLEVKGIGEKTLQDNRSNITL
jgi:competence protein ComEA